MRTSILAVPTARQPSSSHDRKEQENEKMCGLAIVDSELRLDTVFFKNPN